MAGLSSRFSKAGYTKPKFQLEIENETMFEWAVKSFKKYFTTDTFLFIAREEDKYKSFLETKIKNLGIKDFRICFLDFQTKGQAETVYEGLIRNLDNIPNEGLYIFNIDSKKHNFIEPEWINEVDGYLELFLGHGDHWSFAQLDRESNVLQTAEKNRISDLCSNGLYYFKSFETYRLAYKDMMDNSKFDKGECYIAPMYNFLISNEYVIKGKVVPLSSISFCGTPNEYKDLLSTCNK